MLPVPTLLKPFYTSDPSLKAVVFDVYGTILISASGDIEESNLSTDNLQAALDAANIKMSENIANPRQVLVEMLETFKESIIQFHLAERSDERPYPEVDILKIWEEIILSNRDRNYLKLNGLLCIKCFTFVFEVLCNRIYPMPGMKDVILYLAQKGIPLGIISNAQFYTPVILNYFIHGNISEDEEVLPFDADLTIFSYKHQRSKPDFYLFELLKKQCMQKYSLFADEILFIGNDMFRDIYPARMTGFKTALFAGDAKSLRLRKDKPELNKITPDYVITDLNQLLKILN
jgi:putative hydrolase of the HAD superfamily